MRIEPGNLKEYPCAICGWTTDRLCTFYTLGADNLEKRVLICVSCIRGLQAMFSRGLKDTLLNEYIYGVRKE